MDTVLLRVPYKTNKKSILRKKYDTFYVSDIL